MTHSTTVVEQLHLHGDRFVEVAGLPGLRIARLGEQDGRTLDVVEAPRGAVIPASVQPCGERGRVLQGCVRFMRDGVVTDLHRGDTWAVSAHTAHGPHVVLQDNTRMVVLRERA